MTKFSFCTYSAGTSIVPEVLDDWMRFLSPAPQKVIVAVSAEHELPGIYTDLRDRGAIDEILFMPANGRSPREIDHEALRAAVEAADSEWIVMAKLDVLPYRSGHDGWIGRVTSTADAGGFFGLAGSFRSADLTPGPDGFCRTQRTSNNFSLFRRADWLRVTSTPRAAQLARGSRHGHEMAIEEYLRTSNSYNLFRPETPDWTVFHVNQWGDALRRIRADYFARKDIERFMNIGEPLDPSLPRPPWNRYYGYPKPRLGERVKGALSKRLRALK